MEDPKSTTSITSGNLTLKSNPFVNQQFKQESNYAAINQIVKSAQKLFDYSETIRPNDYNLNSKPGGASNNSTKKSNQLQASVTFKDQESSSQNLNGAFSIEDMQKIGIIKLFHGFDR